MMKKYTLYILLMLLLALMLYFGTKAYENAILFEQHTQELVSHQGVEEQATRKLDLLAKSILGSLYEAKEVNLEPLRAKQKQSMQKAKTYTLYFMVAMLGVLFSYFFVPLRTFVIFGALSAMITLVLGLITPILMVTIHKEVEYIGDIVLSFESKGVMGSIVKLWESGDVVVALVILLFSVLVPVLKVFALLFVAIFMENRFAHNIVKFFKMIGKWSMVDVFVVAVFLVYLTSNNADVSRAEVEVGLYFFLAYVIVSMLVSLAADKMLRFRIEESQES